MKTIKALGMGALVVGSFGFSAMAMAETHRVVDVQSVQAAIAKAHAGWKAKDTWVNRLSRSEITRMMGLQKPPKGSLDFQSLRATDAPTSIDWRNKDGINWLGAVMNQGNCGSCVAFSTVATLEARVSIAQGAPWLRPTFSPAQLFACGGGGCETGWLPDQSAQFLQTTGIVDEACMPYTEGSTGEDQACGSQCADAASRTFKIAAYNMPSSYGGSIDAVKEALKSGPLETTLTVYGDFVTYGSGVYKHVTGDYLGGHAVSLVGYDDAKRAWLIRNSWGQEWGDKGFCWVSWDDTSGIGSDTWAYTIGQAPGVLAVGSPADREYVSGQYSLQALGSVSRVEDVQFHLTDSSGRDVLSQNCSTKTDRGCSATIDTTTLKEGRYEIYATGGSGLKSQVREFFVLNSEPKATITFQAVSGTDLSQPLKGRPEFNITAQMNPVPLQHIEFRAIDASGKIAAVKSNDSVLGAMKMGWRTMTVSDGQYTILFHGETKYNGKTYSFDSNTFTVTVKN